MSDIWKMRCSLLAISVAQSPHHWPAPFLPPSWAVGREKKTAWWAGWSVGFLLPFQASCRSRKTQRGGSVKCTPLHPCQCCQCWTQPPQVTYFHSCPSLPFYATLLHHCSGGTAEEQGQLPPSNPKLPPPPNFWLWDRMQLWYTCRPDSKEHKQRTHHKQYLQEQYWNAYWTPAW